MILYIHTQPSANRSVSKGSIGSAGRITSRSYKLLSNYHNTVPIYMKVASSDKQSSIPYPTLPYYTKPRHLTRRPSLLETIRLTTYHSYSKPQRNPPRTINLTLIPNHSTSHYPLSPSLPLYFRISPLSSRSFSIC